MVKHLTTSLQIALITALLTGCNYNHITGIDPGYDEDPDESADENMRLVVQVIDYSPMPGQYVNVAPPYEPGDDAASMALKAEDYINRGYLVSLGSWGGSITLYIPDGISHRVSGRDFLIAGNSFYNNTSHTEPRFGGSEPGVILVSEDGERWYEIAGSEQEASIYPLTIRYYAPDPDSRDILWSADNGDSGVLEANMFHLQSYFPEWVDTDMLEFTGRRLPDNGYYAPELKQYVQRCFAYGYADSRPNATEEAILNLAWAVDENGSPVELPLIHYIKIYTGVFQSTGPNGECSTEVCGVEIPLE